MFHLILLTAGILTLGLQETTGAVCAWQDAVFSNGNCFKFVRETKSWSQAQAYCESLPGGGTLAHISSSSDISLLQPSNYGFTTGVWIGAKKVKPDVAWRWPDRTPAYLNGLWDYGEPNNNNAEDCVELYPQGRLNDDNCGNYRPFICMDKPVCAWQDAVFSNGNCFKYVRETKSWSQAQAYCESLPGGGTLAHISSNSDMLLLQPSNYGFTTGVWIGAKKVQPDGVWRWPDRTPANLNGLWDYGEPNNINSAEDCVELYPQGLFNDHNCDNYRPFICMDKTLVADPCSQWPGAYSNDGKCFKAVMEFKNWNDAQSHCQSLPGGGTLAQITSNTDLSPLIKGLPYGIWIGANDVQTEGFWRWADQTPANLGSLWSPGQPSNSNNEDCVELLYNGELNDNQCGASLPFLCMAPTKIPSCTAVVDLIYVLDSSGSIGKANYQKQIQFTTDLASNFQIGPSNVLVGAIVFSDIALKYFDLKAHPSITDLRTALSATPYMGYTTYTDKALDLITNSGMFTSAAGARSNSYKTVVVITDGQSNNTVLTQQAAARLKSQGITINAVGIGAALDSELQAIASSSSNVFKVNSFDSLKQIVTSVTQQACKVTSG